MNGKIKITFFPKYPLKGERVLGYVIQFHINKIKESVSGEKHLPKNK